MECLEHCRACLAARPYLFLPLGDHPPANMLARPAELEETQPTFSLNTQACLHCGLIQVADQIPADSFRHHRCVRSAFTSRGGRFLVPWPRPVLMS